MDLYFSLVVFECRFGHPSSDRVTKLNVQLYSDKLCAVSCSPKSLSLTTCIIALRKADKGLLVEPSLPTQSTLITSIARGSHLETYFTTYRVHAVITCRSTFAHQFWSISRLWEFNPGSFLLIVSLASSLHFTSVHRLCLFDLYIP